MAQTDGQKDKHGDSMTESAQWSRFCEIKRLKELLLALVGLGCWNYIKAWGGADQPTH